MYPYLLGRFVLVQNEATGVCKPSYGDRRGYGIQHIPVPVPNEDKLGELQQEGHPA